jgi:hypothetical protein
MLLSRIRAYQKPIHGSCPKSVIAVEVVRANAIAGGPQCLNPGASNSVEVVSRCASKRSSKSSLLEVSPKWRSRKCPNRTVSFHRAVRRSFGNNPHEREAISAKCSGSVNGGIPDNARKTLADKCTATHWRPSTPRRAVWSVPDVAPPVHCTVPAAWRRPSPTGRP